LASRIIMRRSLPCSSSLRCASVDSIPSHLLIHPCLTMSLGKTGSYAIATAVLLRNHGPSFLTRVLGNLSS
jgi:hypothetical protein